MTKKKIQCDECGYYWENNPVEQFPQSCPVCFSSRIHRLQDINGLQKKPALMLEEHIQHE